MKRIVFPEPSLKALPYTIAAWLFGTAAVTVLLSAC
jgi:hypothetical protein